MGHADLSEWLEKESDTLQVMPGETLTVCEGKLESYPVTNDSIIVINKNCSETTMANLNNMNPKDIDLVKKMVNSNGHSNVFVFAKADRKRSSKESTKLLKNIEKIVGPAMALDGYKVIGIDALSGRIQRD